MRQSAQVSMKNCKVLRKILSMKWVKTIKSILLKKQKSYKKDLKIISKALVKTTINQQKLILCALKVDKKILKSRLIKYKNSPSYQIILVIIIIRIKHLNNTLVLYMKKWLLNSSKFNKNWTNLKNFQLMLTKDFMRIWIH